MALLPVIDRELRASARHPSMYWIRVLGVLALFIVLFVIVGLAGAIGPQMGGPVFGALHGTLFGAIWLLVPLLTADCISRERREGTLPLLFLTPLRPRDIVYAKGLAHGLKALTLWLSVMPIMAVPILAGGVSGTEVFLSLLVNFSSLCLAIGAGVLASAGSRVASRAMALAFGYAFGLALLFLTVLPMAVFWLGTNRLVAAMGIGPQFPFGVVLAVNFQDLWRFGRGFGRFRPAGLLAGYGFTAICSLGVLFCCIGLAAWAVRRSWRNEPASGRVQRLQQALTKPLFFQPLLKRWLRWQLGRNPIGWLEQRSWSGRLVVWSWFAVVVCVYSSLFANFSLYHGGFHRLQSGLASLLAGSIALSASGSFRRERETGVLELLLVAPLREWQIIGGRIRGLWMQFLPAIILLFSVWLYCATFLTAGVPPGGTLKAVFLFAVSFATLPVIGLYFSLARAYFMAAFLWTLLVGIALPAVSAQLLELSLRTEAFGIGETAIAPVIQLLISVFLARRLHENLKHRRFAMGGRTS